MKISLCIITLNEEANLSRCLKSCVDLVDEIVVVDSGSTDGTESIAKSFTARWHQQEWLGYVRQKNHMLGLAKNDWVLSLDADEELSPDLRQEIKRMIQSGPSGDVSGYSMPRRVRYQERWIRHGDWYPDRLVRLFQRQHGRFEGGKVHERLAIQGQIHMLHGDIYHYSFTGPQDHWNRCKIYARLWAETQYDSGRKTGPAAAVLHAAFRWFRGYVLRRGFLDGKQGWQIAALSAREVHLKYTLLRRMTKGEFKANCSR